MWNEFIFFLSHGNYKSPQVGRVAALRRGASALRLR